MSTTTPLVLEYALLDVFAERPLEGNMLAVFTDARGLTTAQMQALARETNLSETTFILPRSDAEEAEHGVRVRIFTTREELPFAGHPTLGTAAWLYANHPRLRGAPTISLALEAGKIAVDFEAQAEARGDVFGTMRQIDPTFGATHEPARIAAVLNVPMGELDSRVPIQTVSTGIPFCIVLLRSLEAIEKLNIPGASAQAYLDSSDARFFFCMAPASAASGAHFHSRMQFYNGEDPATGSASGCAIAHLVRYGIVPSGRPTIFEQGVEILRPSRLHVQATLHGETVTSVVVGGRTIPVASGRFFLPQHGSFTQAGFTQAQH